jgi:hypothetical protein
MEPTKDDAAADLRGGFIPIARKIWCGERDSNSHALRRWNLNPVRLPIPPSPHTPEHAERRGLYTRRRVPRRADADVLRFRTAGFAASAAPTRVTFLQERRKARIGHVRTRIRPSLPHRRVRGFRRSYTRHAFAGAPEGANRADAADPLRQLRGRRCPRSARCRPRAGSCPIAPR